MQQQLQIKRKSRVLGFILELLIGGLGFLYAGAGWGKAIILFVLTYAIVYVQIYLQQTDHATIAYLIGLVSFLFLVYREISLMRFIGRRNRDGF